MDWNGLGKGEGHQEQEMKCEQAEQASEQARQQARLVENSCIKVEMQEAPVQESLATDGEGH